MGSLYMSAVSLLLRATGKRKPGDTNTTMASTSSTPEPSGKRLANKVSPEKDAPRSAHDQALIDAYHTELIAAENQQNKTVFALAEQATRALIESDMEPHPLPGMELLSNGRPIVLSLERCTIIMRELYIGKNAIGQSRHAPICHDIYVILKCKYYYGLQRVDPMRQQIFVENPLTAIRNFDELTHNKRAPLQHAELRSLILRYYHPVASIAIPSQFLEDNLFFERGQGAKRIQAWKVQMAAFITLRLLKGVTSKQCKSQDLASYETTNRPLYFCFILPIVHTMVMMMDNEPQTNLTVNGILTAKPGSWFSNIRGTLREHGVWSYERLTKEQCKTDPPLTSAYGQAMCRGIEYTVAQIFLLLVAKPEKMAGLTHRQLWITDAQKRDLYTHYNQHVTRRGGTRFY